MKKFLLYEMCRGDLKNRKFDLAVLPVGATEAHAWHLPFGNDTLHAAEVADHLAPDAVIVSIAAGIDAREISAAFGGRRTARIMPTTAGQPSSRLTIAAWQAMPPSSVTMAPARFMPGTMSGSVRSAARTLPLLILFSSRAERR